MLSSSLPPARFITSSIGFIIPIVPVNCEIAEKIPNQSFKQTKNEIQKEKNFDTIQFNKLCEIVKNVKHFCLNNCKKDKNILLLYSSIDNDYVHVIVDPQKK